MSLFNRQGWGRTPLLLATAVAVFVVGAVAQEMDTAYVPFTVNVNAAVTAQLKDGSTLISLAQMSVAGGQEAVLKIPMPKSSGVGVAFVSQRQRNAPALISGHGGKIALNLPAQSYKSAEISLYSVNGKRILRKKISVSTPVNNISRPNTAPGAYLLSVKGSDGNAIASRLMHGGGGLAISVSFGGENAATSAAPKLAKKAAVGNWTITVSAAGYVDSAYSFVPVEGTNPPQNITLREAAAGASGTYAVKVSSAGTGASGSNSYAPGATVSINAGTAPAGYRFINWTTASNSVFFTNANIAATTFTMPSAAVTVTANFEKIPTYLATVVSEGSGATGGGYYAAGATINIYAGTVSTENRFMKWSTESGSVTFANADNAATTFIMPASAVTVTANFEQNTFKVAIVNKWTDVTGGGDYRPGATVNITTAVPDGYTFINWTSSYNNMVFADANSATTAFIMPSNAVTVQANFEEHSVTIIGWKGEYMSDYNSSYATGATVSINAGTVPDGYTFKNWTCDGGNCDIVFADANSATTTFRMQAGGVRVKAHFAALIGESGTFTDSRGSGTTYKYVTIGGKRWMAENLNYDTADGTGSWCYDNDPGNCAKYGRLYNWYTARNACPSGWHLPDSRDDWADLAAAAGGCAGDLHMGVSCYKDSSATKLKSTSGWDLGSKAGAKGGNGSDEFGFSALPGGTRNYNTDKFGSAGRWGEWWTSRWSSNPPSRWMSYDDDRTEETSHSISSQGDGYSVRCVGD